MTQKTRRRRAKLAEIRRRIQSVRPSDRGSRRARADLLRRAAQLDRLYAAGAGDTPAARELWEVLTSFFPVVDPDGAVEAAHQAISTPGRPMTDEYHDALEQTRGFRRDLERIDPPTAERRRWKAITHTVYDSIIAAGESGCPAAMDVGFLLLDQIAAVVLAGGADMTPPAVPQKPSCFLTPPEAKPS